MNQIIDKVSAPEGLRCCVFKARNKSLQKTIRAGKEIKQDGVIQSI